MAGMVCRGMQSPWPVGVELNQTVPDPMATYTISIEGGASFPCADDTYILDAPQQKNRALICRTPAGQGPAVRAPARCSRAVSTNPTRRSGRPLPMQQLVRQREPARAQRRLQLAARRQHTQVEAQALKAASAAGGRDPRATFVAMHLAAPLFFAYFWFSRRTAVGEASA
jgi:hypothetical protein